MVSTLSHQGHTAVTPGSHRGHTWRRPSMSDLTRSDQWRGNTSCRARAFLWQQPDMAAHTQAVGTLHLCHSTTAVKCPAATSQLRLPHQLCTCKQTLILNPVAPTRTNTGIRTLTGMSWLGLLPSRRAGSRKASRTRHSRGTTSPRPLHDPA